MIFIIVVYSHSHIIMEKWTSFFVVEKLSDVYVLVMFLLYLTSYIVFFCLKMHS